MGIDHIWPGETFIKPANYKATSIIRENNQVSMPVRNEDRNAVNNLPEVNNNVSEYDLWSLHKPLK